MSEPQSYNPWNEKPSWCQPWTILLTGMVLISGSWFLLHTLWFTLPVAGLIFAWWGFFLILWPRLMRESMKVGEKS